MKFKKSLLCMAVAASTGFAASAHADVVTGVWSGVFTLKSSSGGFIQNTDTNPSYSAALDNDAIPGNYSGGAQRGAITGSFSWDTATGTGSATLTPFSFCGGGDLLSTPFTLQAIGNGFGGPGTLVLGNMDFGWNGTYGIPVSAVFDAVGFFGAVGGGLTVSQTITGGATPGTDNGDGAFDGGAVIATTTWNTATVAGAGMGSNPSGTLPLSADTIGGDPMIAGPFMGSSFNFDIMSLHVTSVTSAVPIPAAIWLFGSGLLGLAGIARRRRAR